MAPGTSISADIIGEAIKEGRNGWYVTLRIEGLKAMRYGPFESIEDARKWYGDAMADLEYRLYEQAEFHVGFRKVGKVCRLNSTQKGR
jgi:hypothetical protein